MFRAPAVEPVSEVSRLDTAGLIPLSHLELDLPRPPEGWADFLGRRAIAFVPDDLGRDCVRRQDARRLLDEKRANELRVAKFRKLAEAEQEEADRQRRAQIWQGVSVSEFFEGVAPATAMLLAARDSTPRRRSMIEDLLDRDAVVFHPIQHEADGS